MEAAAARRVDRARHLALEHDPLATRRRSFDRPCRSPGSRTAAPRCTGGSGARRARRPAPISTMTPRYMTAIRSETWRTTPRSCAMKTYVRSNSSCRSSSRFTTCAWIETSSAETGSSATISCGLSASARATPMRWRWPPENSCGIAVDVVGRQADDLEQLAHAPADLARARRSRWMRNGSPTIWPTRLRGLSDAYGSWKIICISRRNGPQRARARAS